jgi:hypothetical protein
MISVGHTPYPSYTIYIYILFYLIIYIFIIIFFIFFIVGLEDALVRPQRQHSGVLQRRELAAVQGRVSADEGVHGRTDDGAAVRV